MPRSREEVISEMVDSGLFTDDEIRAAVSSSSAKAETKSGFLRTALNFPEEKAREGLTTIAQAIPSGEPTGNLPLDVLRGTPRIAAETLAETAPGFVSPEAIVTGGALRAGKLAAPLIKSGGKLAARGLEALSGLEHKTPGVLTEAAKDSTLLFGKESKTAKQFYEAAKAEAGEFNIFKGMFKPDEIVETAKKYIANGGILEPSEALMYRKAIDKLFKSGKVVKDELIAMRAEADAIAKQSENIRKADPLFARGLRVEALRNFLPQNKLGGSSAFKTGIGAVLGPLGATLSPLVQGIGATATGVGARLASRIAGPTTRTAFGSGSLIGGLGFGRRRQQ